MSVFVVRAFVRLREMLATNRKIAGKLEELESRLEKHDTAIQDIIDAIKELMAPDEPPRRKIGFQLPREEKETRQRENRRQQFATPAGSARL